VSKLAKAAEESLADHIDPGNLQDRAAKAFFPTSEDRFVGEAECYAISGESVGFSRKS
jgi:hypothetical protein